LRRSPTRDSGDRSITSPLREELETQSEKIKLKEQNLDLFTECTELRERTAAQERNLKKKDTQIKQLKDLLNQSDQLRDEMLETKLKWNEG